jgi:hypothetical protein
MSKIQLKILKKNNIFYYKNKIWHFATHSENNIRGKWSSAMNCYSGKWSDFDPNIKVLLITPNCIKNLLRNNL